VLQQRYKERAKTKFIKFTDPNDCFSKHLLCWQLHLAPGEEQVERYFASVEVLAEREEEVKKDENGGGGISVIHHKSMGCIAG